MKSDVLTNANISKMVLIYKDNDGKNKKELVRFKFQDKKETYFCMELPSQIVKPKKKTPIELQAYTPSGVYKAFTTLRNTQTTLREVFFVVDTPTEWNFVQLRISSRIETAVSLLIKFGEDFEITTVSHDLSLGGVSFYYDGSIPSIYKKVPGTITLKLPEDKENGFVPSTVEYDDDLGSIYSITGQAKYVREARGLVAFKFLNLAIGDKQVLREYLLSLELDFITNKADNISGY